MLKRPLTIKTAERRRKSWKRSLLFSAPNSGMHQTLVQKRSDHTGQKRKNFLPTGRWGKTTPNKSDSKVAIALAWHRVFTGKSLEVLREVLLSCSGKSGCRGAPGSASEGAQCGRINMKSTSGALPGARLISLSTLGRAPQSTPISQSQPGSTSRSTSRDFPASTPVPGQGDCNSKVIFSP